jgi:hypothetical protein
MTIDHLPRFRALPIVLACIVVTASACTPVQDQSTPTAAPTSADIAPQTGTARATGIARVSGSAGALTIPRGWLLVLPVSEA